MELIMEFISNCELKYLNQCITITSIFLILVPLYFVFIFFPHKIKNLFFIDKMYKLFSVLLPKNIIANKLKKEFLKRYKIEFIPYDTSLSKDEFLKEYINLYEKGQNEPIYQKIVNLLKKESNHKALIYGDGGMGKSATAKRVAFEMEKDGYIPIFINKDFEEYKDDIFKFQNEIDEYEAKILQAINYQKFIFIFDNTILQTFENSNNLKRKYTKSKFILTSRKKEDGFEIYQSLNNLNLEHFIRELLIANEYRFKLEISNFNLLILAIIKKYKIFNLDKSKEILKEYIDKQQEKIINSLNLKDMEVIKDNINELYNSIFLAMTKKIYDEKKKFNYQEFKVELKNILLDYSKFLDEEKSINYLFKNVVDKQDYNLLTFLTPLKNSGIISIDENINFSHDLIYEYFLAELSNKIAKKFNDKESLEYALSMYEYNKEALIKLAKIYENENIDKAIEYYEKAGESDKVLELIGDDESIKAFTKRANIYFNNEDYDKALEEIRKIIEYYSNTNASEKYIKQYADIGLCYYNLNKYSLAETYFKKYLNYDSEAENILLLLIAIYLEKNNLTEAKLNIDKLLKINSTSYDILELLGDYYMKIGDLNKATKYLKESLKINSLNIRILKKLGNIYSHKKSFSNSEKYLLKALTIETNNYSILSDLGGLYISKNEINLAKKHLNKAIKINQNDISVFINFSRVYAKEKDYEKSIKYLEKAMEIDKNYFLIYYNLGGIYAYLKEYNKAIINYHKSIELNPNYPNNYYNLSEIYSIQDNHISAKKYLDKYNELIAKGEGNKVVMF